MLDGSGWQEVSWVRWEAVLRGRKITRKETTEKQECIQDLKLGAASQFACIACENVCGHDCIN